MWRYDLGEKKSMKLSDEAAFILMEQKKVKMNKITVYVLLPTPRLFGS